MKKFVKNTYSKVSPSYRRMTYIMNLVRDLERDNTTLRREIIDTRNRLDEIRDISLRLESNINTTVQQQESTRELIETTIDIENMPKATGVLRDIQMISLGMLKEVERICKKHKLEYWLDFGTLLGAVRPKGFIPWDDDMDISMMSDSYEKFVAVVDEELADTDYRFIKVPSQIGKMVHRDFMPHGEDETAKFIDWNVKNKIMFAMDITPYYYVKKSINDRDLRKFVEAATNNKLEAQFKGGLTYENFHKASKIIDELHDKITTNKKSDRIFMGLEVLAVKIITKPWVVRYDDIFPVGSVAFEGLVFASPNNTSSYLSAAYGDYMKIPSSMPKHIQLDGMSVDEIKKIRRIAVDTVNFSE